MVIAPAGSNRIPMPFFNTASTKHLEKQYLKRVDRLKRKLNKGAHGKDIENEINAMTLLAIAIHENHHQSYTRENPLLKEIKY